MLVDSHCHLDRLNLENHDGDLSQCIVAAKTAGVGHLLCVSITFENAPEMITLAEKHSMVSASVGVHPTEVDGHEPTEEELLALAKHPSVVAVGETGLDYYRLSDDPAVAEQMKANQQARFRRHVAVARQVKKPLIIHTRHAKEDTLAILEETKAAEAGVVLHCFTEDWDMARRAIDLGCYISFSGIITFKNAKELQETVKQVPLESMLVETDAPYLTPTPYRGKPNEPGYVRYVAHQVAALKDIPFDVVAEKTTENFFALFSSAHREEA